MRREDVPIWGEAHGESEEGKLAVDSVANFMRTLALPQEVKQWSLTTLRDKPVRIGAKVVRHGRYVTFQVAEVAVPRTLFAEILRLIEQLWPEPAPT